MSEFHDPELRQELGRLSGPYPDENAAFAAWQRRVGQARRRRAVGWTTAAAMSLIVATVGFAALQNPGHQTLVPGKEGAAETTAIVRSTVTTVHNSVQVVDPTNPSTTSTTTLAPDTTPSTEAVEQTVVPDGQTGDVGGAAPTPTTHKAKAATPATVETTEPPTSDNPGPQWQTTTFESIGGSVTVGQYKDHLVVLDTHAAGGFHKNQTGHFDHTIDVTFTSGTHQSEITVWLDHGTLKHDLSEKPVTHEESAPGDSSGGGDHGG